MRRCAEIALFIGERQLIPDDECLRLSPRITLSLPPPALSDASAPRVALRVRLSPTFVLFVCA